MESRLAGVKDEATSWVGGGGIQRVGDRVEFG
jgi:hypothetical protein